MDIEYTAEETAFRDEVRAFVAGNLPKELAARARAMTHVSKEDIVAWHRILHRRGWSAPGWPKEYGGPGWSPIQRHIFDEETAAADAPPLSAFGINMVGPVIYTFGSPEQKAFYLPRILSMEDFWCQGYSEPGAGSDLASLQTRAESDGDHYVINGSKIWTSSSHRADRMFCLVRTDPSARKQEGISFVLIDMKTPGITVNPIISIDGGHELNEVFFDNVRVPKANRIGDENKGWTYAKFLLGNERFGIVELGPTKRRLQRLKEIARQKSAFGASLIEDGAFKNHLAGLEIQLLSLEYMLLRGLSAQRAGRDVSAEASILKIRGTEILQAVTELTVDALGYFGLPYEHGNDGSGQSPYAPDYADGRMEDFLFRRAATIYGGANEIQRNILAKTILR
jgi:alkylation response protein AidB-like acyl-CoA dehydrogenase